MERGREGERESGSQRQRQKQTEGKNKLKKYSERRGGRERDRYIEI